MSQFRKIIPFLVGACKEKVLKQVMQRYNNVIRHGFFGFIFKNQEPFFYRNFGQPNILNQKTI